MSPSSIDFNEKQNMIRSPQDHQAKMSQKAHFMSECERELVLQNISEGANCQFPGSPLYECLGKDGESSHITVKLCDEELWRQFNFVGTEMVLTKAGRRIFPAFRVQFQGLARNILYRVMMDIVRVDNYRYKFQNGSWIVCGKGEAPYQQDLYTHPMSSVTGEHLMKRLVSFHKVKLTNAVGKNHTGTFLLHSMHRYQLRVHITRCDRTDEVSSFSFPQTSFITVTAYQNAQLSQLKIANNPFARGFRPDGARKRNKRQSASEIEINDTDFTPHRSQGCSYETMRSSATGRCIELFPTDEYNHNQASLDTQFPMCPHPPVSDSHSSISNSVQSRSSTSMFYQDINSGSGSEYQRNSSIPWNSTPINSALKHISSKSSNQETANQAFSVESCVDLMLHERRNPSDTHLYSEKKKRSSYGDYLGLSSSQIWNDFPPAFCPPLNDTGHVSAASPNDFLDPLEVSKFLGQIQKHP